MKLISTIIVVTFNCILSNNIIWGISDSGQNCSEYGSECNKNTLTNCCGSLACLKGTCLNGMTKGATRVQSRYSRNPKESELKNETNDSSNSFTKHPNYYLFPNPSTNGEDCGTSVYDDVFVRRVGRVVGGKPAKSGQFPWMVQLLYLNVSEDKQMFHCGGSLINSRYVLTAAHCVSKIPTGLTLTTVNFGMHLHPPDAQALPDCSIAEKANAWSDGCSKVIDNVIIHENYVTTTHENDVALLRLETPINYTKFLHVRPICLPFRKDMFKRSLTQPEPTIVAGWGRINPYFDTKAADATSLNTFKLNLLSRDYCDFFFSTNIGKLGEDRLCATGEHGKSQCNGDSGSPAIQKLAIAGDSMENRYFQLGIVSIGGSGTCGRQGQPLVLPNVVEYMPWILNNIRP